MLIHFIFIHIHRYNLAEINFAQALKINSQSSFILCHIGMVQYALKEVEKALNTFNMAIALNPKNPFCRFHRDKMYFALGRHAEALKDLEELRKIIPKESQVYSLIGQVHKKLGNTDLALMHFSWSTDLDPKGASSQIKETIDPSIGRSSNTVESPASPVLEDEIVSGFRPEALNFGPDDSEDSL